MPTPKQLRKVVAVALLLSLGTATGAQTMEPDGPPGATLENLLEAARASNPEFASMRLEADAARERPESVGAFPDPSLRIIYLEHAWERIRVERGTPALEDL